MNHWIAITHFAQASEELDSEEETLKLGKEESEEALTAESESEEELDEFDSQYG